MRAKKRRMRIIFKRLWQRDGEGEYENVKKEEENEEKEKKTHKKIEKIEGEEGRRDLYKAAFFFFEGLITFTV